MNRPRIAPLLAALLLAACARSEDAGVPQDLNALEAAEQAPAQRQEEEEPAIGEWRESLQDDSAALEFGPAGATPLFSLRCDERGAVLLQRHGTSATGDLPVMLVTVGGETRRLAVTNAGGTIPMLRATLPPRDPFLASLAEPEPVVVRIGDSVPLALPPSPAIGAFLTACASGQARPERAAAGDNAVEAYEAEPAANTAR